MEAKSKSDLTELAKVVGDAADSMEDSSLMTALTTLQTTVKEWKEKVEAIYNTEDKLRDAMDEDDEDIETERDEADACLGTLVDAKDGLEEVYDRIESLKSCLFDNLQQAAEDLSSVVED